MPTKKAAGSNLQTLARLILVCFFLSGLTGLIYEVLWTRLIVKIIGGSPFAISIILTIFMAGLGLGSYLAGRTIDRVQQPGKLVRIYGVLELIIGGYGFILPLLIGAFQPVFAVVYNQAYGYFMLYNLLTFVGCSLLLIIPVTCMGATLPVLCRFYVTSLSHLGTHAGRLYGLNTVGAAVGALMTGFWLLSLLGIWGTLAVAVVFNAVIGLVCIGLSRKAPPAPVPASKQTKRAAEPDLSGQYQSGIVYGSLAVFAASGFSAMTYEVIWTKLLALIVGPTTYSFTIVLATFILGLALGSVLFGWLADRTGKPASLLAFTQIAAGVSALAVSHVLGNSQLFFAKLIAVYQNDFTLLNISKAGLLFLFMIVPTLCLGATFPTVSKIFTRSAARVGRSIGVAYAINTIGAVLGSFCAGFVLVPALGKASALSVSIGLQLLVALIFSVIFLVQRRRLLLRWAPAVGVGGLALILCFHYPDWNRHLFAIGKYQRFSELGLNPEKYGWLETLLHGRKILEPLERSEVVYYGDGVAGTTTVSKAVDVLGNVDYTMANSGKPDASNRRDMATQTVCAHFPMLFHPDPKSVMVLGLASGVTAGEVLYYPVERLDVVEISSEVVAASDYFIPWNNNVLADPRTTLIVQDGRAHLTLTDQKYDVIISEPSNPWMAGLATLFTRDFFSSVRNRLNDGGMFVQFIHVYQMDWPTFAMVGRTFADVFPNSLLIGNAPHASGLDYYLVGIKGPNRISLDNALRRVQYTQHSSNVRLSDPRLLYWLILSEDLKSLFGTGPLNTDSRPRLEFAAPKLMFYSDPAITRNIIARPSLSRESQQIVDELSTDIEAQIGFVAYALSVHLPFHAPIPAGVDFDRATKVQQERYFELIERYCYDNAPSPGIFRDDSTRHHCIMSQIEALENKVDSVENVTQLSYLAKLCRQAGRLDKAAAAYRRWLEIEPANVEVHNNLALTLADMGLLEEAIDQLSIALELASDKAWLHLNLGLVWGRTGNIDSAISQFNQAVNIDPDLAEAHCKLGIALLFKGRRSEAIKHLQQAILLKPSYEEARAALQQVLSMPPSAP